MNARVRFRSALLDVDDHDERVHSERWVLSYADFITLLFAFFVVMYAISSVNDGKFRALSSALLQVFADPAVRDALEVRRRTAPAGLLDESGNLPALSTLATLGVEAAELGTVLRVHLADAISAGELTLDETPRWTLLALPARVAFDARGDALTPAAAGMLETVGGLADLAAARVEIRVVGEADAAAPRQDWRQAAQVAAHLEAAGVDAGRLVVSGSRPGAELAQDDTPGVRLAIARGSGRDESTPAQPPVAQESVPEQVLRRVTTLPGPEPIRLE